MKFYTSQLTQLIDAIAKGKIRSLLLYGPDKGYISFICRSIIQKMNLLHSSISYNDINESKLETLLNSRNFFAQREFIKITTVTNSINTALKSLLANEFLHFAAFIADELPSNSGIRNFFESQEFCASVACYPDDQQNIAKIIHAKFAAVDKRLDDDALYYLKSALKGDYQLICNELEKLLLYAYDKDTLTIDDIKLVINIDLIANGDDLCTYFAQKDTQAFLIEIERLMAQGINMVLIIRALIRYYMNLYIVVSKIDEKENIDTAIKNLSPPIFFKRVADFKKVAFHIQRTEIVAVIAKLYQAEINFKLDPKSFDLLRIIS